MTRKQHGWYTSEYKIEVVQKYLSDNFIRLNHSVRKLVFQNQLFTYG